MQAKSGQSRGTTLLKTIAKRNRSQDRIVVLFGPRLLLTR